MDTFPVAQYKGLICLLKFGLLRRQLFSANILALELCIPVMKISKVFASCGLILAASVVSSASDASAKTLLGYTFENFDVGQVSGGPSDAAVGVSGFWDMANNGAEDFGPPNGKLSMTRFAGGQVYPILKLSASAPISLDRIAFEHIHNHNPGFPTYPQYDVDLQFGAGSGYSSLAVFTAAPGGYAAESISGPGALAAGDYFLRWIPLVTPDTNTEFFGLDNVKLVQNDVPGPLPLLGLGAAFRVSRRMRRRLGSAAASRLAGGGR
jgi:hypothetical protein